MLDTAIRSLRHRYSSQSVYTPRTLEEKMSNEISEMAAKSKYLAKFQRLQSEAPESLRVEGDLLIVEALPKLEKKVKLGDVDLIIADDKSYRAGHNEKTMEFGVVVMAGPGDIADDGSRFEMNVKVGDVILLPGNMTWYSQFGSLIGYEPYSLGVTRAASVLINFPDPAKAFEVLNA
jgi:co-chaperonin GroES (HSP10)